MSKLHAFKERQVADTLRRIAEKEIFGHGPRLSRRPGQQVSGAAHYDSFRGIVSAYDATYKIVTIDTTLVQLPTPAIVPQLPVKAYDKYDRVPSIGDEIWAIRDVAVYDDTSSHATHGQVDWLLYQIGAGGEFVVVEIDEASMSQDVGDTRLYQWTDSLGYKYFSVTLRDGLTKYWLRSIDTERKNEPYWLPVEGDRVCFLSSATFNPDTDAIEEGGPDDERTVVIADHLVTGDWLGKITTDFTAADPSTDPPTPGTGFVQRYYYDEDDNLVELGAPVEAITYATRELKAAATDVIPELVSVRENFNHYEVIPLQDGRVSIDGETDPLDFLHVQWADTENGQEPAEPGYCPPLTLIETFRDDTLDDRIIVETIDSAADAADKKERMHIAFPGRFALVEEGPLKFFDEHVEEGDYNAFIADQASETPTLQPVFVGFPDTIDCEAQIVWWTAKGGSSTTTIYVDPEYIYEEGDLPPIYIVPPGESPILLTPLTAITNLRCSWSIEAGIPKLTLTYDEINVWGTAGAVDQTTECSPSTTGAC